jgi:putative salt-induced outer membrane protein YdiY
MISKQRSGRPAGLSVSKRRWIQQCGLLLLMAAGLPLAPLRADVVALTNGDRVSGQIVAADTEALTIKTEYLGEVKAQWPAITEIRSDATLFVTDANGQVLVGPVSTSEGTLRIRTAEAGIVPVDKAAVRSIRNQEQQQAYAAEIERLRDPSLLDFWSGYFDTGLSFTQGNSETRTFTTAAKTQRKTDRDKITVYATSILAQNSTTGDTETTANAIRGGSRYELNVSDRLFTFGFIDLEFDEFQNLDLRNVLGGGMGWHVKQTERTVFDVFAGGSFNQEFFSGDITRRSAELVVGEELNYKLSDRLNWSERLVFYPNLSEGGEYRLQFDTALVTQLYHWVGWQISLSNRFLTNPIPGIKKNDLLLTTGLRFNFGRENLR